MKLRLPRHSTLAALAILSSAPAFAAQRPLETETVASGMSSPLYAVSPAGDYERLFIVQQGGLIRILENGSLLPTPFLDVTALTNNSNEQGLLGLAFHPDYDLNGWFYINYTNNSGNTRVDRFTVSAANPDVADAASQVNIFSQSQPFTNHNGGCIAFGADGHLYIGMGDGGSGGDPGNRAQNPQRLLGKMLRLDVNNGLPYTIPSDNPFVNDGGVLDEIWAFGVRNPWRFSFDSLTGDMWIADVGQSQWEEIDFELSEDGGHNYGWRFKEGDHCYNPSVNCDPGGLTDPIFEFSHGGTPFRCSITGGFVYRGERMATMQGRYFYADYCSGQVWSFRYSGGAVSDLVDHSNEFGTISAITSFGQDAAGELYVISQNGAVRQLAPAGLKLDTSPIVTAGSQATLSVTDGTASSTVWITYSLIGLGSTSVPSLNVVLDLATPTLLTTATTDAQGAASLTAQVPQGLMGNMVWAQALQLDKVSNVLVRTVQ